MRINWPKTCTGGVVALLIGLALLLVAVETIVGGKMPLQSISVRERTLGERIREAAISAVPAALLITAGGTRLLRCLRDRLPGRSTAPEGERRVAGRFNPRTTTRPRLRSSSPPPVPFTCFGTRRTFRGG